MTEHGGPTGFCTAWGGKSLVCESRVHTHDLISPFEGTAWATMEKKLLRDKYEK